MQRSLGLLGYYRKFIANYATIANSLYGLLKKNVKFVWGDEHQRALHTLIKALKEDAVLKYPRFDKPFFLETDASNYAMGAILSQETDGERRPIAFVSKTFAKHQQNYATTEKECLAVVWGLNKFRHYLLGSEVNILTVPKVKAAFFVAEDEAEIDDAQLAADIAAAEHAIKPPKIIGVDEDNPDRYTSAVKSAKQHIEAGDIYQANLSRQWTVSVTDETSSESIYESLCRANPGPFAGIARWNNTSIISSSPERLIAVRDGQASTRPIAGTRPRGEDSAADDDLSSELFAHPKERAEHVMLIDLERNDLGRVCEAGSVEVDEMMVLETYAHVHHIVSNVTGTLREDVSPGQAIAAVFPGGTITGCPKVRCMEIINELENSPRGAYTGSFGYLNLDGSLDLNILIRTMVKKGNEVSFRAGAGIVADSIPAAELDEARAKAEGMLRSLTEPHSGEQRS